MRHAVRTLVKNPGFTSVVVLTLALGVGVNTAIFSVVNAVMLRPLPFAEPERLVRLWESNPEGGWPQFSHSHPNFLDWRTQQTRFEYLAAYSNAGFTMTSAQGAEVLSAAVVTSDFLPLLRVTPMLGRNFTPAEDRPGGETTVAILGHGFWQRRFGGSPSALGQTMSLNGTTYTVIGVLPPTFDWGDAPPDLMVPLVPNPARSRGDHRIAVIGRLKPGVTLEEAQAELAAIADRLAGQYPKSNGGWTARSASFYDWVVPQETRQSLLVLLGAVGLVLLIAWVNVANLLLARGAVRQKELSIRTALGAERSRIVRQLLTESLLLSLVAGTAGLALGVVTTRVLVAFAPESVPRLNEVSFDLNVLGFALAVSVLAAFVFGLVPALQASRPRPADALRDGVRAGTSRQRLRAALTIVEVAISVALLIGAGLLLRSFGQLQAVQPGFDIGPLMTMRATLPRTTYKTGEQMAAFYERLLAEARAQPGIVGVATSSGVPLTPGNTSTQVTLLHRQPQAGEQLAADWRLVSPGYFATMGIALRGRDFTPADRANTQLVTIISEEMARRYWGNEDPIGKPVIIGSFGEEPHTVIGVAGDVRSFGLDDEPGPMVYGSALAYGGWNPMNVVWRSAVDPQSHVPALREAVRRIDPSVGIFDIRSLPELLSDSFGPRRFNMYLLGVFAGVALLLAAIGLFGVMAYLVAQRTREIGVRVALGANRADILRLVLARGMVLTLGGAAIGLVAAMWLTRTMESLLFAISPNDPTTFIAVPAVLVLVALAASYVPVRRALQVDPTIALRAE